MRLKRRAFVATSLLAFVAAALNAPPARAGVDPFYESLLREGRLAYERGDWAGAAESLRLACFGLLDEPPLLTEGLARLAVAQARSGDTPGFRDTFQRIVDVHDRFGTYTPSALPAELRSALEAIVVETIPAEYLASSSAFGHLAAGRLPAADELATLPAKRRRAALIERLEADPGDYRLTLLLAETELELGNREAAAQAAGRTLELDPGNQNALCVRGRAQAELGRCSLAVEDLETCRKIYTDADSSLAMLTCQAELGRIADARRLLAALPEDLRDERPIRRFARRLPEPEAEAPLPASTAEADTAAAVAAASPSPLDAEEAETLEQARDLLHAARTLDDLERALVLARAVADGHPAERAAQHLVAEIAYRASRFAEAVTYFERGGLPGADEPKLLFYLSVAYWESGRPEAAAEALRRALPSLQRSSYVDAYVEKILGREGAGG